MSKNVNSPFKEQEAVFASFFCTLYNLLKTKKSTKVSTFYFSDKHSVKESYKKVK